MRGTLAIMLLTGLNAREARTRDLTITVIQDPRVRRIFLEPHLKARLGLSAEPKVRLQGCWAARHDDHIHVDVH